MGTGDGRGDGRGGASGDDPQGEGPRGEAVGRTGAEPRALSRRNWLRGLLPVAMDAAASVAVPLLAERPIRPPGALSEGDFLALCTRCGKCAEACPYGTVFVFGDDQGPHANTPVLFPAERPCRQCDGYPCAAACEPGALRVPTAGQPRLGGARIDEARCLPFSGPECGACAGLCPSEQGEQGEQALTLRAGRPAIDSARCTGCGMCISACPVSPSAIESTP